MSEKERVAIYLSGLTPWTSAWTDPVGELIASHQWQREELRRIWHMPRPPCLPWWRRALVRLRGTP